MNTVRLTFLIGTFIYPAIASACPPGSVLQRGNGWEGCIQSTSSSESEPYWKKQWGAIATDGANAALGVSAEIDSKKTAEKIALRMCAQDGGKNCKVKISYYNQCVSVASSHESIFVQSAGTREEATSEGMNRCASSGEEGCKEFYSGCSLPKRIR